MKGKLFFIFIVCACFNIEAQTYCYKITMCVEKETGIKRKGYDNYYFITFINNKRNCYFSDKDGNTTTNSSSSSSLFYNPYPNKYEGENYYTYKGVEDGYYVYEEVVTTFSYVSPNLYMGERGGYYSTSKRYKYLYINKNYDRINEWTDPEIYNVSASSSDSQALKAMKMGMAIGSNIAPKNPNRKTTIYVYERTTAPQEKTKSPIIFY